MLPSATAALSLGCQAPSLDWHLPCRCSVSVLCCAGHVTFFWNGNRSGYLDPKLEKFEEVWRGGGAEVARRWRWLAG